MATFAQSIEVKLAVDTTSAFDALKRVESKMAQVFGAVSGGSSYQAKSIDTVQEVTKAVEQQTTKLQQFATKISSVFSSINFDAVKNKAASATGALKNAVQNIAIPKIKGDEETRWIKASDAAKRYNLDLATMAKWYERSASQQLKAVEQATGAFLGKGKRINTPALPLAGKEDYFNVPTAAADKFYDKMQLLNRVIYSALTQADSKANLVVARVDKIRERLYQAVKPALLLAQQFAEIGKQNLYSGIELAEKKAKEYESILKKIFNLYLSIYTAPFKMAGKMWNFFTTPKISKTIDPNDKQQVTNTIAGFGNLAGANNINVVINEVKKLEKEAKKTAGAMSHLKNALVFTVKIPLLPFTTLYNAASWTFDKIKSIGMVAFAAVAGFAYKFKNDISTFLNFDREMAMVSTLLSASSDEMEKLKEKTKRIAKETGSDIAETAKGLYWTISGGVNEVLGYTEQNMLNITKQASEIAAATGADATSATRAIMGVINTYGTKLGPTVEEQAKRVSDVLFQTTFLGITSVQELAQEIGLVTPIWAQMELPIEELGAALAVLTRGGMNTATALTALKSTITEIMKPSEQASILAQKLGIDFSIAGLRSKGYPKFMADILEKTKGMPEHLVVLFNNVRSLTEVLGKAGNQDLFLKYLREVENAANVTDIAIGKIRKSEAFQEKQLDVRFQIKSEEIGAMLAPTWLQVKKRYLEVMTAATLYVKMYWKQMSGDKSAAESFKSQYENVLASLPNFLRVALIFFQKIVEYAYHFGMGVYKAFSKIFSSISDNIVFLNKSLKFDVISTAIRVLGDSFGWVLDKISSGIVWVIEKITDLIAYFGKMGKQAEKTQEGVSSWSALGEFFSMLGGIAKEVGLLFVNLAKVVGAIIGKIVEMEKEWGLITNVLTVVAVVILAPLYVIGKIIQGTLWLVNLWLQYESQLKGITTIFALIAEGLGQIIWAIFNPVDALKAAWETLVGIVKGFYNLLIDLSQLSMKIGSSIYSTISEWTFGSDKKVVETKKKEIDEIQKKNKDAQEKIVSEQDKTNKKIEDLCRDRWYRLEEIDKEIVSEQDKTNKKIEDLCRDRWYRLEEIDKERQREIDEIKKSDIKSSEEKQKKIIDIQKDASKKIEDAMKKFVSPQGGVFGAAAGIPKQENKTTDTFSNTKKEVEKIIDESKKVSEKTIEIKTTEKERLREIQFQKEQAELRHLAKMDDILEKDMKRQANIVKKGIEEQQKIIEKIKDRQSDFLKRKAEAEEDFEEKKARIIMAPLSQEGKDIQQRGLANLYQNKLSQALGQNNFQEAHMLAKKVQDIYAGLAERQDNSMRDTDFKKFLDSQNQVMKMFDLEKKSNEESIGTAEKRILDLKKELSNLFVDLQKNLSISVSTSQAEDQLLALRKKFTDMRKDFAEFLPGGEEFQYERNPEISLFGDKKELKKEISKEKGNEKLVVGQKIGNEALLGILGELRSKKQESSKTKSYSQDNKGQFVTSEIR